MTPVPKVPRPVKLKDLRKILGISDYSKLFESFLKDWIIEDVWGKISTSQYAGKSGTGTEHMIVCFVDRIKKILDKTMGPAAVIAAQADWAAAFDRIDPTLAKTKFINLQLRP